MAADDRLTRSVSFGRDFFHERQLSSVGGTAVAILQHVLQTDDFGPVTGHRSVVPANRSTVADEIRGYWARTKGKSAAQRWFEALADNGGGPKRWLDAAGRIVEDADVERHGGWISTPGRRGAAPPMKGESLRGKRNPSVSELMAVEVPVVAAENNGWLFAQSSAADLALDLHKWDPAAAVPVLRDQLRRCTAASDASAKDLQSEPNTSQSTQTTEQMARDVGRLTVALAASADAEGVRLYQAWVVHQTPAMPGSNAGALLQPIWRFPDNAELAAAADDLFNRPGVGLAVPADRRPVPRLRPNVAGEQPDLRRPGVPPPPGPQPTGRHGRRDGPSAGSATERRRR